MPTKMTTKYYPDPKKVKTAMRDNDPLLVLVSFDGNEILLANIDDAFEHVILLRKLGHQDSTIDQYFRLIVNKEGADWTFACPSDYKKISDKSRRIETFYNDGIDIITKALTAIGYEVKINIPQRYRRHFDMLGNDK